MVVAEAIRKFGTKEKALNYLLGQSENGSSVDVSSHGLGGEGGAGNSGSDVATSSLGGGTGNTSDSQERSGEEDENGSPSNKKEEEQKRDVEMEDEITAELQSRGAFSDYEIDVTKEGEAINEYLTLLSTPQS